MTPIQVLYCDFCEIFKDTFSWNTISDSFLLLLLNCLSGFKTYSILFRTRLLDLCGSRSSYMASNSQPSCFANIHSISANSRQVPWFDFCVCDSRDFKTCSTFQCCFNVVLRLIWQRDVSQHETNVETMLCTSTFEFTTLNNVELTLSISTSIWTTLGNVQTTLWIWAFAKS